MDDQTIGQLIERVGRDGDSAAMGDLFDLTAPDLYRLALRLAGNPTDAEDALQETFLAVMRGASSFDPAQRAGPWLTTILAHEVERVRRRRTSSPLEHDVARAADDAGDHREEWAQARAAIGRLPERYRRVLVLRFEHGLTPAKIGEALGIPASTVRSLLTRGTAKLRRTLGVASLAMLPAPLLGIDALERVRARVIPATAAAGAGTLIGGMVAMTTKTAVGAGLVIAIGIAFVAWLIPKHRDDGTPRSAVASTRPTETARATPSGLPEATAPAIAPVATPSPPPSETEADSMPARRLDGRVLDEAGAPVTGVRVYLVAADAPAIENTRRASANVVVTTDENGAFRFVDPPVGTWDLGAAVAGYCPALVFDVAIPEGGFATHGEVTVRRGFTLTGRVIDPLGNPIEGASVLAGETGSMRSLHLFDSDETYLPGRARALRPIFSTTTAADGSFSLGGFPTNDPLPLATWKEGWFAGRDRPRSECADAQPGRAIDLVLAPFAPVRLVVRRRETNEPVRRFTPWMRPAPSPMPPDYRPSGTYAAWKGESGNADDDGARLVSVPAIGLPMFVGAMCPGSDGALRGPVYADAIVLAPGLAEPPTVLVLVGADDLARPPMLDKSSLTLKPDFDLVEVPGHPLPNRFDVVFVVEGDSGISTYQWVECGADGTYAVSGLAPGRYRAVAWDFHGNDFLPTDLGGQTLEAFARSRTVAMSREPVDVTADRRATFRLEFGPCGAVEVTLADELGRLIERASGGLRIEGAPFHPTQWLTPATDRGAHCSSSEIVGGPPAYAVGIPPGRYTLGLSATGFAPFSQTVDVQAGEIARVAVRLARL